MGKEEDAAQKTIDTIQHKRPGLSSASCDEHSG